MADESRVVSASGVVNAPVADVFEEIADPSRQPAWDGNENLNRAPEGQRVHQVDDVFVMFLKRGGKRENRVVEFEEGRLIAWLPNVPGKPSPGHLWRWTLRPIAADRTEVVHTYDWTNLRDRTRLQRARATTPDRLQASIDRLAALFES
ncbi:MAG TPA: SRPBCC family protein [Mycobacteriales bacterium]|nr:SRPBCC family protein [Mycobacteriales bacterium]